MKSEQNSQMSESEQSESTNTKPNHSGRAESPRRSSMVGKGLILFLLSIMLYVPSLLIMNLSSERQEQKQTAYNDIAKMWGKPQTISGFYIRIPDGTDYAYIYPATLNVTNNLATEIRKRGIYKVPIYKNHIDMQCTFTLSPSTPRYERLKKLNLSKAELVMQVYDLSKGLDQNLNITANGKALDSESDIHVQLGDNTRGDEQANKTVNDLVVVPYPINLEVLENSIKLQCKFLLNGTEYYKIIPSAVQNNISISGNWKDPSVIGERLPTEPLEVNHDKFDTKWNFVNRNINTISQRSPSFINNDEIGISMLIPVDTYTKTERSIKYAIMIIMLCFASMYLIEIINKKELHIIHYVLTGISLVIFYILLLSISEYTGFNLAYAISAIATIVLLTWFVGGILRSRHLGILLGIILSVMYIYNFILLNAQEYALLMGSIGLFIIMAIIMYFTRKISFEK